MSNEIQRLEEEMAGELDAFAALEKEPRRAIVAWVLSDRQLRSRGCGRLAEAAVDAALAVAGYTGVDLPPRVDSTNPGA